MYIWRVCVDQEVIIYSVCILSTALCIVDNPSLHVCSCMPVHAHSVNRVSWWHCTVDPCGKSVAVFRPVCLSVNQSNLLIWTPLSQTNRCLHETYS